MVLGIAAVIVLVLLVIALLPVRKREETRTAFTPAPLPVSQTLNLRQQQLREESTAIADEYERLAHQAWLEEVRTKATGLLSPSTSATAALDE